MEHYLDNAATTAVLPCAREAAIAAMDNFGNPGSLHARGTAARKVLDDSRKKVAAALSVKPARVTFTSGGSESTNTALRGAVHKNKHLGKHIVSTQIEHDATPPLGCQCPPTLSRPQRRENTYHRRSG